MPAYTLILPRLALSWSAISSHSATAAGPSPRCPRKRARLGSPAARSANAVSQPVIEGKTLSAFQVCSIAISLRFDMVWVLIDFLVWHMMRDNCYYHVSNFTPHVINLR